jgi:tetratricopeptide (TPR) repeat protein
LTICELQHPELIWIYLLRGYAYGKLKQYPDAEDDFQTAFEMARQDQNKVILYALHNNRGLMRVFEDVAMPVPGASRVDVPGSALGQGPLLATSALSPGREKGVRAEGILDLQEATNLRREKYDAWYSLAQAYLLDGKYDEAAQPLEKAIAAARKQLERHELESATLADMLSQRARLSLRRSHQEAAIRDLEEAEQLAGDNYSVLAQRRPAGGACCTCGRTMRRRKTPTAWP